MRELKKQKITCQKCGKTRNYLYNRANYCTQCGSKFTFFEKLYNRIKWFFRHI